MRHVMPLATCSVWPATVTYFSCGHKVVYSSCLRPTHVSGKIELPCQLHEQRGKPLKWLIAACQAAVTAGCSDNASNCYSAVRLYQV